MPRSLALALGLLAPLLPAIARADVASPPVSLGGWTPSFAARYDSAGAPNSAGANYAAGDTITLATAGGNCTTAPVVSVATLSGSGIATFWVQNPGVCTVLPPNPLSQAGTSGAGSGATFTLVWAPIPNLVFGGLANAGGNTFLGLGAGANVTNAGEHTFIGYQAGARFGTGCTFDSAFGHNAAGIGTAQTPIASNCNSVSAFGTDALRNYNGGSSLTALGASALSAQATAGVNNMTAVGSAAMQRVNSGFASNNSTAIGEAACKGAVGSSVKLATCLGAETGLNVSTASGFTLIGQGVGKTTFASGSGVILIGSGNVALDTPAAGTSNYLNVENLIVADTGSGHFTLQNGSAPSVGSGAGDCGTAPAVAGNDNVGLVTVGSSSNGGKCTLTFHTAWTTAPVCVAQNQTTGNLLRPASTTTTLTLTGTLVAADRLSFMCKGYQL